MIEEKDFRVISEGQMDNLTYICILHSFLALLVLLMVGDENIILNSLQEHNFYIDMCMHICTNTH
jgi:hypothetical protein